jgi:hypothetical protein
MDDVLSRWQFGATITYHFLFVPLTIGLALLVAVMQAQVLAYRRRDGVWERLTRFFGTLFLINFAMGIVTGIVQEFQFGMKAGPLAARARRAAMWLSPRAGWRSSPRPRCCPPAGTAGRSG